MGNLDFHPSPSIMRYMSLFMLGGARGDLMGIQEIYQHQAVMRPPSHSVNGSLMESRNEAPLLFPARIVSVGV